MAVGNVVAVATDDVARLQMPVHERVASVTLPVFWGEVAFAYREGNSLVVVLEDGSELLLAEYFTRVDEWKETALLADGMPSDAAWLQPPSERGEIVYSDQLPLGRLEEMFSFDRVIAHDLMSQSESSDLLGKGTTWAVVGGVVLAGAIVLSDDEDSSSAGASGDAQLLRSANVLGAVVRGVTDSNAKAVLDAYEEEYSGIRDTLRNSPETLTVQQIRQLQALLFIHESYVNPDDHWDVSPTSSGLVVRWDSDIDGTVDEIHTWRIDTRVGEDSWLEVDFDVDASGTAEIVLAINLSDVAPGRIGVEVIGEGYAIEADFIPAEDEGVDLDFHQVVMDGDGTVEVTPIHATMLAGVPISIESAGSTEVVLADDVLLRMADAGGDGTADTPVIIDSDDSNDILRIPGATRLPSSDAGGRQAWREPDGTVLLLVDPDISVDTA